MNKTKIITELIKEGLLFFHFLAIFFFLVSCENELTIKPFYEGIYKGRNESISGYITSRQDTFSVFKDLINAASMYGTLTAYNPHGSDYTLFLPTNEAFNNFIAEDERYGNLMELMKDTDYVNQLVRYHVVNRAIRKNDFPYGALTDTTLSGDLLTIGFSGRVDSVVLKVNNEAAIIQHDIELTNGYIHIIDEVLKPIVFSSYEWLEKAPHYSIFTQALIETGLKDIFEIHSVDNEVKYPPITLLVEPDEVFHKKGIFSVDDLKIIYSSGGIDYKSVTNGLYQFVAYHILDGKRYLNNLEGVETNFNTYGNLPIYIDGTGLEIKINSGADIFDTIITNKDTTFIKYIRVNYDISNVTTKNGAIHTLRDVMEPFRPVPRQRIFQFLEEPKIFYASQTPGNYIFNIEDLRMFEIIKWEGVETIEYFKSSSSLEAWQNDYLEIEGDFSITYEIPKMLPGNYSFEIRANDENVNNATIQVSLDGKSFGGSVDLTSNPNKTSSFHRFVLGNVFFDNYESHIVKIETLIPGKFTWDAVILTPN